MCLKYRFIASYFKGSSQKLVPFHTFGAKGLQIIPERHSSSLVYGLIVAHEQSWRPAICQERKGQTGGDGGDGGVGDGLFKDRFGQ